MRRALTLLLLVCTVGANAADVVVTRRDGKLGVRVNAVLYPANLSKDLVSGLTNRLYARISLLESGKVLEQRAVEIALRYDLWDEKFSLVSTMNETVVESRTLANIAEAESMLAALPLPGLFDIGRLTDKRDYLLRVELLLNPIDREKMRTIRKWVSQNTSPSVAGDQMPASNAVPCRE